MRKDKTVYYLLVLTAFLLSTVRVSAREYRQFPAAIHIHSKVSSGVYSIAELADSAHKHNLKILILTDHALIRAEYGLFPLRRLIRKVVEKKSLLSYRAENYINLVNKVDKSYPDLILIPGTEVAPFYYWRGSYFKKDLTLHNWQKQILVIGLNKESDYRNLPLVSNSYSSLSYGWGTIFYFWPLAPLILGLWLVRKRRRKQLFYREQVFITYPATYKVLGLFLIILSGLFLVNNFPFTFPEYDQYHGDQGIDPYQNLIDYVNSKKGLTFWSAPEATTTKEIGEVKMFTPAYPQDLLKTRDYTGFAALYLDNITFTDPGKGWDQILNEYCRGERYQPVWGIGEIDYHGSRENIKMNMVQTILLLPDFKKEEVLEAFKKGRMYAVFRRGDFHLVLDDFSLSSEEERVFQGEELRCAGKPRVNIEVSSSDSEGHNLEIKLIRNGEILKVFKDKTPFKIEFEDDSYIPGEKIYYRLDVRTPGSIIISNPIFVILTYTSGV
jgi:hypothetical protein